MCTFWIIVCAVFWILSVWGMLRNQLLAPAFSYLGLFALSIASNGLMALVPINNTILIGWLCMTLVVMLATVLQPVAVRQQRRGTGYLTVGAFTGLAIGLLGFTITSSLPTLYGLMVIGVAAGAFFGYIIFSRSEAGAAIAPRTGNFFRYLLAKGFPIAISVMIMGVAAVIVQATYNMPS